METWSSNNFNLICKHSTTQTHLKKGNKRHDKKSQKEE